MGRGIPGESGEQSRLGYPWGTAGVAVVAGKGRDGSLSVVVGAGGGGRGGPRRREGYRDLWSILARSGGLSGIDRHGTTRG